MSASHLRLLIPSFNRACQLECLLRSLFENCSDPDRLSICAFFRHTDAAFAAGYDIVRAAFPTVQFVPQILNGSFKRQILDLMDHSPFFGILVDDMVVLEGFSPRDREFDLLRSRPDIFSLSLRLDAAKTFSQPINMPATSPVTDRDLVWRWKPRLSRDNRVTRFLDRHVMRSAFYDWEVPCALDGTVFRSDLFRRFFETVDEFENIPFIERAMWDALRRFEDAPEHMVRYPRARAVSLAMNSVDEYHDYPSLGLSPQAFNERFLAGGRLDYTPFRKIVFHACHVVTEPFWMA